MKKKILFRIGTFPKLSETFIISQLTMALEMGFTIIILVNELAEVKSSRQEQRIEKYNLLDFVVIEDYKIPKKKWLRLLKALIIFIQEIKSLKQIISLYRIKKKFSLTYLFQYKFFLQFKDTDIVHIQYGTNSKPIDELKKIGLLQMPVVTTFHGHDAFFPINGFIPMEGYYDILFKSCEIITVNTPYLQEQLIKINCPVEKLHAIPVSVDTDYFYKKKSQMTILKRPLKFLSVGRLESIKGHHYGIQVVNELLKKGYDITYYIIGKGRNDSNLKKLIAELSLENRVQLLGARSHEEIRNAYWESDLFLMTSTVFNNQIRETQGLVTLEAQACGLPVVAFDSGGVKYTIDHGNTGFICEENNIEEFINAVEKLISNSSLYEKFSRKGPNFVEDTFSYRVISAKWEKLYNDLING